MRFEKNVLMDRRGSTLIEIVVSVLIVGIAFVPLMIGLNAAVNTNRNTEKQLYAENAAGNVSELCKVYGQAGMNAFAAADAIIVDPSADPDPSATPTPEPKKISDIFSTATISKDGTDDNKYYINNIQSGTDTYYATIVFSTANYDKQPEPTADPDTGIVPPTSGPRQNDFEDFKSISKIENAMPISVPVREHLSDVIDHFYDEAEGDGSTASKTDLDVTSSWLEREIIITVNKVGDKYSLEIDEVYVSRTGAKTSKGDTLFTSEPTSYKPDWVDDAKYSKIEIGNEMPSFFIMTYGALKDASGAAKLLKKDTITIKRKVADEVGVCSIVTEKTALTTMVSGAADGVSLTNGAGKPMVSYWTNVSGILKSNIDMLPSFGGTGSGKQSKMKDAKITIYDNASRSESHKIIEKISTIIEFE